MSITFWRTEEEWAINWLGKDSPYCISSRAFKDRAREIIKCRQHEKITDLPPLKTAAKGPSKVTPAENARIPITGIIIKKPTNQSKAPATEVTIETSVPPLEPLFFLPTLPREQVVLTTKELTDVLQESGGDGQPSGFDLNEELSLNEYIIDKLPQTNEATTSSSSTEVDENIHADLDPDKEETR